MGRQSRVYFEHAVYHVAIRGNNRQDILESEEDKRSFLKSLDKFRSRFEFKLYGFVLMDNHAHLIIGTNSQVNISKIMHAVALSYSVKFRRKYGYVGYVWQGRFKSNIIESDRYILECLNYIHNNPVRAGITGKVEDYIWSSYRCYNGLENKIGEYVQIDKFSG